MNHTKKYLIAGAIVAMLSLGTLAGASYAATGSVVPTKAQLQAKFQAKFAERGAERSVIAKLLAGSGASLTADEQKTLETMKANHDSMKAEFAKRTAVMDKLFSGASLTDEEKALIISKKGGKGFPMMGGKNSASMMNERHCGGFGR